MTRVKLCGIMKEEEVRLGVAAGAHALGFVTEYPVDVPWNLDRDEARRLMGIVPPFVYQVIVVGDDPDRILSLAAFLRPHAVQLHGGESLNVTRCIVAALASRGVAVIKALRFSVETGLCDDSGRSPLETAKLIEATGVKALLMDSVSQHRPAGTGKSLDWAMAREIRDNLRIPVILAGGLHGGNVARAIDAVHPLAVDVISGVEDSEGNKDPRKVEDFIAAAAATP